LAAPVRQVPAKPKPASPKPAAGKPTPKKNVAMEKPEDIIPLDDDGDFEDF
jgi:hypothetical protein